MTESQTVSRKPFHPLLVALFAGVVCWALFPVFEWVINNSYVDPEDTLRNNFKIDELLESYVFGVFGAIAAFTTFLFLFGAQRAIASRATMLSRAAGMLGSAMCMSVNLGNVVWAADELRLFGKRLPYDSSDLVIAYLILTVVFFILVSIFTRAWSDLDVVIRGVLFALNSSIGLLLFAIPAHIIAKDSVGWLTGIGTFIACYFSLQVLIVSAICGFWLRKHTLRVRPAMHEAASRYAKRESMILASAAFFLLILSYAIYPLAYRDRIVIALFGQLGFCVFASCAVARGISGFMLRDVRPFWILGIYALLAEFVVIIFWQLILPGLV